MGALGKPEIVWYPGGHTGFFRSQAGTAVRLGCTAAVRAPGRISNAARPPCLGAGDKMNPLDPLDAAMMTAELLSSPMHVGAVLVLSPPADAKPDYVDEVYREALAGNESIDPRLGRYPHRGVDTGGMWVWRDKDTVDMSQHCQRRKVSGGRDGFWRLIGEVGMQSASTGPARCGCVI